MGSFCLLRWFLLLAAAFSLALIASFQEDYGRDVIRTTRQDLIMAI